VALLNNVNLNVFKLNPEGVSVGSFVSAVSTILSSSSLSLASSTFKSSIGETSSGSGSSVSSKGSPSGVVSTIGGFISYLLGLSNISFKSILVTCTPCFMSTTLPLPGTSLNPTTFHSQSTEPFPELWIAIISPIFTLSKDSS
jgi:hypothetical protein